MYKCPLKGYLKSFPQPRMETNWKSPPNCPTETVFPIPSGRRSGLGEEEILRKCTMGIPQRRFLPYFYRSPNRSPKLFWPCHNPVNTGLNPVPLQFLRHPTIVPGCVLGFVPLQLVNGFTFQGGPFMGFIVADKGIASGNSQLQEGILGF